MRRESAVVIRQRLQPLILFPPHIAARGYFVPIRASVSGDGGVRTPYRSAHVCDPLVTYNMANLLSNSGGAGENRTLDLWSAKPALIPTELRPQNSKS